MCAIKDHGHTWHRYVTHVEAQLIGFFQRSTASGGKGSRSPATMLCNSNPDMISVQCLQQIKGLNFQITTKLSEPKKLRGKPVGKARQYITTLSSKPIMEG